jgi:PAS domain S-box-containing protein
MTQNTILLVDDGDSTRILQKMLLEKEGYQIYEAENGLQALKQIQQALPDLIISDVLMPEMDGFELCRAIKANPMTRSIPFIFYSAYFKDAQDIELAEELEASCYMIKPADGNEFVATVQRILEQYSASDKTALNVPISDRQFEYERNKRLLNVLHDNVSHLENCQTRFKKIIESLPLVVYQATDKGETRYFFSPVSRYLEHAQSERFNSGQQRWMDFITPDHRKQVQEKLGQCIAEKRELFRLEYQVYCNKQQDLIWLEDQGHIKYDDQSHTHIIYGSINDITERKNTELKLMESFENTILSISLTLEKRDPYTAGHQNNVARIAVAVAKYLGLSEHTIKGLQLAAQIHDIGKIYLPAEILNKPARLSDAEFGLVKTHSQVGHDIIGHVDFPWPIARMILEHHERLDGSGYPQGLTDEQICYESKIICVADVVDAMSSDRPYRKGLGLEKALNEIRLNRGKLYAPEIVDACLSLFTEQHFSIKPDAC